MCPSPTQFAWTFLALLASACGGNGSEAASAEPALAMATTAAPAHSVTLEGCVVDEFDSPRSAALVRALSSEGALLNQSISGQDGLFRLRGPANQTIRVALAQEDGQHYDLLLGTSDLSIGACLRSPIE